MGKLLELITGNFKKETVNPRRKKAKVLKTEGVTAQKLERIIAGSALVTSGRVHLLGLAELKLKLGDKWPSLRERILDHLTKIVTSHIGASDVFFSRSDDEHIIVFSEVSEEASRVICSKILRELSAIYLGSADTSSLVVKTAVGKCEGELLFEDRPLDAIFKDIAPDVPEEKTAPAAPVPPAVSSSPDEEEMPYDVMYKPIWDVRNETISTYMVNTQSIDRYKNIHRGYDVLVDANCIEAMIGMDYMVMVETINTMDDLFQNNFRAIFTLPVCYETLFNTDMIQGFLSRCKIIPPVLYKYISFALINFPEGVPETKLRFIVSNLMSYSRGVVVALDSIPQNVAYYQECGVKGLSIKSPDKLVQSGEYWTQLAYFVNKCKQVKMYTAMENIHLKEDLLLAKEVGINFLSGDSIGPYVDIPGHMARMSWKDLMTK